jgi:ATP-dependent Clp protease adaptor protein ClpS
MPANTQPATVQETRESTDLARSYHLILLNDDDHSYEYVVYMLSRIFGYSREKGFAMACVVDSAGSAIVETADYERVTGHQRQIHAFGADPLVERCAGSMSAVVEPAP